MVGSPGSSLWGRWFGYLWQVIWYMLVTVPLLLIGLVLLLFDTVVSLFHRERGR